MVVLPNADRTKLNIRKLTDHLLDSRHPVGGHKAHLFQRVLGFTGANANDLAGKILTGVRTAPAIVGLTDQYGTRYIVDMAIDGPRGRATVRTGWIIDHGETEPRFVTAYVTRDSDNAGA